MASTKARLRQLVLQVVVMVTASGCMGLATNALRPDRLPLILAEIPSPGIPIATWRSVGHLTAPDAAAVVAQEGVTILDVRDRSEYDTGHLPGAVSLPLVELPEALQPIRGRIPLAGPTLIYSNGSECLLGFQAALRLQALGYKGLCVLEGGYPAWRATGLPIAAPQRTELPAKAGEAP